MKEEDKKDSKYTFGKLFWIMGIVLGLWLVSGASIYFFIGGWDDPGMFGDMFGAINALFSGLAFAGIIFTIFLQRKELELQRKELELTRSELTRTASAQEASQKELSKQAEILLMTAQINAINSLMSVYQGELDFERRGKFRSDIVRTLEIKIEELQVKLSLLFEDLELENLDKE